METQFKARYDQIKELPNTVEIRFLHDEPSFIFIQEQLFLMCYSWKASGKTILTKNKYNTFTIDKYKRIALGGNENHPVHHWSEFFTLKPEFKGLLASKRLGL